MGGRMTISRQSEISLQPSINGARIQRGDKVGIATGFALRKWFVWRRLLSDLIQDAAQPAEPSEQRFARSNLFEEGRSLTRTGAP